MKTFTTPAAFALGVAILSTAAPAFAAGEDHGFPLATLTFSTINVILFLLVMRRYVMPPVRQWVRDRHDRIVRDLAVAAEARAAAEQLKAEWEARMAALDGTLAEMRERSQRDAEVERERILAEAQRTAERILRDAEQAAQAELRDLQARLRAELAGQALRLAEESVRREWTDADQDRFVKEFVQQVQA